MKEIPILFSQQMINAIIEGHKTQTRRVINMDDLKDHPDKFKLVGNSNDHDVCRPAIKYDDRVWYEWELKNSNMRSWIHRCPYKVSDLIWVKETHYRRGKWKKNGVTKKGKQKWKFVPIDGIVLYDNTKPTLFEVSRNKEYPTSVMWYKRNARFMFKKDARLLLIVKAVKAERLHDITLVDAQFEGVTWKMGQEWMCEGNIIDAYTAGFKILWSSINGPDSWDKNPWVYAITFEQCWKIK